MILLPLILLGAIAGAWVAGFVATTDLTVRRVDPRRYRRVVAVFPHADDETVNCGGSIRRLASCGAHVTLVLLTAGERGNPAATVDPALKALRIREAERASGILGVSTLIQQDFGDGMLSARRQDAARYLAQTMLTLEPDLIVTYDPAGLDGHPDHVACWEMVFELWRTTFPGTTLWCVAIPRRLVRLLQLVRQLPAEPRLDQRRARPTARVFVGAAVIPKIRAWYAYRSQRGFIAKGLGRFVPAWFAVSSMQFEYFAEAG